MKNTFAYTKRFIIAVSMLFAIPSCDDYFEYKPLSSIEIETVFTNVEYTQNALMGIYQLMTRDEGYSKRLNMFYAVDNDIEMCTGADLDNGRRDIARYQCSTANDEIKAPWSNLYKGIERANICIENIPVSNLYLNGTTEEQFRMKRMYGEALTLRALFYYELIRNWGDVPFKLLSAKVGDPDLPKTDRDIIYEQIISDLLLAETLVPWRSEVELDERITKGAVKGLLARICLARGGYSLRRESNQMERKSDYLTYYQIARDQCFGIMQSHEHELNPSFENVFRNHCESELDITYGESMWEVGMGQGISSEVGYYITSKSSDGCTFGRGNPGMSAVPTYFLSFDTLDTRRDVTIAIHEIDDDNLRLLREFTDITIAKWRREWMVPVFAGTAKYTGVNWVLLRYSDILLMFAESENEINHGPTTAAIDAFRQVRARAYGVNQDKMPAIPSTYDEFFNEIVKERAWEFGGECIRKYDLIRWNLLDEKLSETKANLQKLMTGEEPYNNVPRKLVWRNQGTSLVILNLYTNMDSTAIADRDEDYWPNVSDWADNINQEEIDLLAKFFIPNKRELLPIHISVVDLNPNLENDFGY